MGQGGGGGEGGVWEGGGGGGGGWVWEVAEVAPVRRGLEGCVWEWGTTAYQAWRPEAR